MVSDVGGGVMLLVVLSEPVERSLPFPHDEKTLAIAIINIILFTMDLFLVTKWKVV